MGFYHGHSGTLCHFALNLVASLAPVLFSSPGFSSSGTKLQAPHPLPLPSLPAAAAAAAGRSIYILYMLILSYTQVYVTSIDSSYSSRDVISWYIILVVVQQQCRSDHYCCHYYVKSTEWPRRIEVEGRTVISREVEN